MQKSERRRPADGPAATDHKCAAAPIHTAVMIGDAAVTACDIDDGWVMVSDPGSVLSDVVDEFGLFGSDPSHGDDNADNCSDAAAAEPGAVSRRNTAPCAHRARRAGGRRVCRPRGADRRRRERHTDPRTRRRPITNPSDGAHCHTPTLAPDGTFSRPYLYVTRGNARKGSWTGATDRPSAQRERSNPKGR
jgi:hypothetical protein